MNICIVLFELKTYSTDGIFVIERLEMLKQMLNSYFLLHTSTSRILAQEKVFNAHCIQHFKKREKHLYFSIDDITISV